MPTLEESWGAVAKNRGLIYWAADRIWKKYTGSCYRGMARAMRTRRNALSQDHENFLAYEDIVSAMTLAFITAYQRLDLAKGTLGTYFHHWTRAYEQRECWAKLPLVVAPQACDKDHPLRAKAMIAQQSRWWVPLYHDWGGERQEIPIPDENQPEPSESIQDYTNLHRRLNTLKIDHPRTAWIIVQRFFADRTLLQVGEELGMSRERVRQLEARGLAFIKDLDTLVADDDIGWIEKAKLPRVPRWAVASKP